MNKKQKGKLSLGEKCAYGSAAIGDSVGYSLLGTYVLFFLTTVAGIQPAVAGTLTIIGAVWNALINPIIGYLSDNSRSRMGRRRPFMLGFSLPLLIVIIMLFTAVEVTYTLKVIYYGFMIIAYWTAFTGFFVPYYALGAEYTNNYEERTSVRSFASFFNMIGALLSMALPTVLVEAFEERGVSTSHAWTIVAGFLAVVTATSIVITAATSKDKDRPRTNLPKQKINVITMFKEYLQVLQLKPMKWLLLVSLFFLMAYSMIIADFVYLITYKAGLGGTGVSKWMLIRCLASIALIPLIDRLCKKVDKRRAMLIIFAVAAIGLITMRITDIGSTALLFVFVVISSMATSSYWQVMPAVFYDVCEYDEYETGKRREGAILSVQGLVEAAAGGIGTQILGIILQMAGFNGNAAIQSDLAITWIFNCTTIIPILFFAVAAWALYKFPITREVYNDIVRKLGERKNDEKSNS